jgi:endonuclease YncB( thermonuclease family)
MPHDFKKYPELTNNQMQFYYWDSPHKQIVEGFIAQVVKVTDGDTVRVKWDERDFDFPVRMINIDAPELGEGGRRSKQWLANRILGEEVYIVINDRLRVGKWGRILGEIIHQGININEESMMLGHSVPFGSEE